MALESVRPDVTRVLVENHRRFLAFLWARVESETVAEEILQAAFVKGIEKGHAVRDEESVIAWFYRLLRNAVIDHYRHRAVEARVLERHAEEFPETIEQAPSEVLDTVCRCVGDLVTTLKPDYGEMIRRVDLDGVGVPDVAREVGITPNNAAVRLHRARQELRRQVERACGTCATHGCLNCTCGKAC
jgi:RNA polymerase sigma-70 factor (ECF subfamily)